MTGVQAYSSILNYTSLEGQVILLDLAHPTLAHEEFMLRDAQPPYRGGLARAFAEISIRERRWLALATAGQRAIGWGSWAWFRHEPGPGAALITPCTIYGEIYTLGGLRRTEEAAYERLHEQGVPAALPEMTMAAVAESHLLGWRYGRWHSQVEPDGEPGENHVVQLTQMSRAQFTAARDAGWPDDPPGM